MSHVLVLNVAWVPHGFVPLRRALALAADGKATLVEVGPEPVRSAGGQSHPRPRVICLTRTVPRPVRMLRWTKRDVLARDGQRCAYCGRPAKTVDHVHPRHLCKRDGRPADTWQNTVAACHGCQARKGGRTLPEAAMAFRADYPGPRPPRRHAPSFLELLASRPEWVLYRQEG
jgi:5-methylcytosine-specific restriction endonuclease McrA